MMVFSRLRDGLISVPLRRSSEGRLSIDHQRVGKSRSTPTLSEDDLKSGPRDKDF